MRVTAEEMVRCRDYRDATLCMSSVVEALLFAWT